MLLAGRPCARCRLREIWTKISPPRSFERRKASKARHGCQDAHYGLSVAAGRLSRSEMQADGYLVALRESGENTEVVAVALKEGPRRFIARIARCGIVLASR